MRRFLLSLLAVVLLAPVLVLVVAPVEEADAWPTEATVVPADWALVPHGVGPGEVFRLVFLTSGDIAGSSSDIATYNNKVISEAGAGHSAIRPYKDGFRALVSTASVDAKDNIDADESEGGPAFYWLADPVLGRRVNNPHGVSQARRLELLRGKEIAFNNFRLWLGLWNSDPGDAKQANGTTRVSGWSAWTGTDPETGLKKSPLGSASPLVWKGAPHSTETQAQGTLRRLLAVSEPFVVETFDHTSTPPTWPHLRVPADWPLIPADLGTGDRFRLAFVTDYDYAARSRDIEWYNSRVADLIRDGYANTPHKKKDGTIVYTNAARPGHCAIHPYADSFRALVSTAYVDAKDNLGMDPAESGVPVWWMADGPPPAHNKIADNNRGFWNRANLFRAAGRAPDQDAAYKRPMDVYTGTDIATGTKSEFPVGTYAYRDAPFQPVTAWEPGRVHHGGQAQETKSLLVVSQVFSVGLPKVLLSEYPAGTREITTADCRTFMVTAQSTSQAAHKTSPWVHEGGRFTQTVRIDKAPESDLAVNVRLSGTAVHGSDYTISGAAVSGATATVTIPAGRNEASFTVNVADDDDPADETLTFSLQADIQKHDVDTRNWTRTITLRSDMVVSINSAHSQIGHYQTTKVTVTLSRPLSAGQRLDVPLTFAGSTANRLSSPDYRLRCASIYGYPVDCPSLTPSLLNNPVLKYWASRKQPTPTEFAMTLQTGQLLSRGTRNVRIGIGSGLRLHGAGSSAVRIGTSPAEVRIGRNLPKTSNAPPAVPPEISVSADSASVIEGGDAAFTVTARPVPAADLAVTLDTEEIHGSGPDAVVSVGLHTVIVPAGQTTAVYSHATRDDQVDLGGGTLSVTVATGNDYTVSATAGTAEMAVADDDGADSDDNDATPTFAPDAALVAEVTAKADAHSNAAAAERLRRVAKGMTGESGGYTASECRDTAAHHGVSGAWGPWCDEIERRENWAPPTPVAEQQSTVPPPTPAVSIAAGPGVTEGASAVFTLTASPAPASALAVNVTVSAAGDYGVSTGSRTVTITTSGTATLSVATAGDGADEADGSVTATLGAGSGYDVSSTNSSATVAVADDDEPPPAVFVPDAALVAEVTAKADAHSNAAAAERLRRVAKGMTGESGGYTASECRQVADDHGVSGAWRPWCDEIERRENWSPSSLPNKVLPTVGVQPTSGVSEGDDYTFTVTASPAPDAELAVTLDVATTGDFGVTAGTHTVTIAAGKTKATLTLSTVDDSANEPDGAIEVTVASGTGYNAGAGTAAAAVADDDDPPVPDPVPVPPGDAISSDAEALELAAAERDRYASLRSGPRAALYWMLWIRAGGIIDALNGRSNLANNPDNGWYRFRSTIANAVSAQDAQAVDALTRLGHWFIDRYGLIIDPAGHYNGTWPAL